MKKAGLTLVLAAVIASGSMLAFAKWTADGSGSGSATALTAQNVTVTAVTPAACLFPGQSCPVSFSLSNTNPYAITFDKLTAGSISSVTGSSCAASDFTVDTVQKTGLSFGVGAGSTGSPATSGTLTSPNVITMNSDAGDGCQGAVVTLALTLVGTQN